MPDCRNRPARERPCEQADDRPIRAVREQLAAVLALDNQADEQMAPSQRCYTVGTLAGLEWTDQAENEACPCR